MEAWTDERLDDLAAALRPVPEQLARNTEAIERLSDDTREMRTDMREMRTDMREMRADMHAGFAALQRQFALTGWMMAFTVIGAVAAVVIGT